MVQANLSASRPGVLRGMHFHRAQADYWCLLQGRALVALFDLRSSSPTNGMTQTESLDAGEGLRGIYVPPGVAHGFYAHTEVLLHYLVDRAFTGGDEHGIAWDDPALGIDWPQRDPILSDRDRANPPLSEALRDPPPFVAPEA